jgi:hypothetical protein
VTTPSPSNGHLGSRVTVVSPDGRELMWTSRESAVATWQVGQIVSFRNGRWQVIERRAEHADAVTFRLGRIADLLPG